MAVNKHIIAQIDALCYDYEAEWVAVTKNQSVETLQALYQLGIRKFGENKAQELLEKYPQLPLDIEWNFIGHLQTNKVKAIIDKVSVIHAVDSLKLLNVIEKEAGKMDKTISAFIQVHIAEEDTKYGFSIEEALAFFQQYQPNDYPHIQLLGLMAMASNTNDSEQIKSEFTAVKNLLFNINQQTDLNLKQLSMGMSSDYTIALECGANVLRIGSVLFI